MKEDKNYLRACDYEVVPIAHAAAVEMVKQWHYAQGAAKTSVYRHALRCKTDGELVGCALWMPPIIAAARKVSPADPHSVLALSRLVVSPEVATNGASFLLGRSIRLIKQDKRYKTLVTYADARMEHNGAIYLATNWQFDGETAPYFAWLDSSGKQVCKKATTNIPTAEMDRLYQRVGPFRKRRFVLDLSR